MAQASYNHTYTEGVTVAAGGDYFLYNIGSKRFYTDGMDYGTHASADHAGRVVTLAEVSGGFTIFSSPVSANGTDAKAGYLIKNGSGEPYVDGADGSKVTVVFTAVDVDGYTNAYTIKIDDDNYLYYATADGLYQSKMGPFLRYGANTGDANSYWLIIPMSARQAVGDCTYLLRNGDFNHPWELPMWTNAAGWTNIAGGKKENPCAEMYGKGFDIYQTISETIANGRYRLSNQAFYNNADPSNQTYLYANSDQSAIAILNAHGEETAANMAGASDAFSAGRYVNSVETFVSNGSLQVGIKNATTAGNAWNIMNNFHLEYLGQCVMDYAVELPDGGAMTADTWYYFDIAVAGDNYKATADDLSAIKCTNDGYTLTSAVTGDVTLTATNNSLSVTRYYVKSVGGANNLVVAPASYSYTVGSPTLSVTDGAYTNNSLSTFTFTFSEATTNDPGASFALLNGSAKASLKKGGEQKAEGSLSLSGTVLTATFSDVTLDLSSTYTIEIASGVVGYEGQESNAAISATIKTGIIANGVYYFKKKGEYKYLTRGGNYGTETVVDNYGISFEAQIQTDGKYYMKNVDHSLAANTNKYLNAYTDQGAYAWTIAEATGGYYLKYTDGNYMTTAYVDYEDDNGNTNRYYYQSPTENEAEAIVWELLSKAEYATSLTAKKNAEITALATAAGIEDVTTLAQLESTLASDYGTTDMTSEISNALCSSADNWTAVSYNGGSKYESIDYHAPTIQIWNAVGGITQTISSLPEGLYKITVSATWRPGNSTDATRVGNEANTTAWIYANDNITQLKGWYEGGGTINSTQNLVDNAASYLNTVYAYVNGTEDLKIGVAVPSFCQQNWCPIYNWTLTRYEAKATQPEKDALADAITAAEAKALGFEDGEYAPYNNVDALTKLAEAKAIDPATASGASVVAATTALTGATWTANVGEVNAFFDGAFASVYSHEGTVMPIGWHGVGDKDNSTNVRLMWDYSSNAGLNATSSKQAAFLKFTGIYGNETGYTLPLKAGNYSLSFIYGGWNELGTRDIKVYRADNNSVEATVNPSTVTAKNNTAHTNSESWSTYNGYVVIPSDGDYIFSFYRENTSSQNQLVFSDIELLSAPSQSVTVSSAGFATYVPYCDLDFSATSIKAYKVKVESKGVATLYEVDNVPANTPVLLYKEGGATEDIPTTIGAAPVSENDLVAGTGAEIATTEGDYTNMILWTDGTSSNPIGFYFANDQTVAANRAYLHILTTFAPDNAASRMVIVFADETSGINTVQGAGVKADGYYDLQGRRVAQPNKGLYIVNGKKVVIK